MTRGPLLGAHGRRPPGAIALAGALTTLLAGPGHGLAQEGLSYRTEARAVSYGWVSDVWGSRARDGYVQRTWIRDGKIRVDLWEPGSVESRPERSVLVDLERDTVVVRRPREGERRVTDVASFASEDLAPDDPTGAPPATVERPGEHDRIGGFAAERVIVVAKIPSPEADAGIFQVLDLWITTDPALEPIRAMQRRMLAFPGGGGGIVDGSGFDLVTARTPYREALEPRRLEAVVADLEGVWVRSALHLVETFPGTDFSLPLALSLAEDREDNDPAASGHQYVLGIEAARRDFEFHAAADTFRLPGEDEAGGGARARPSMTTPRFVGAGLLASLPPARPGAAPR